MFHSFSQQASKAVSGIFPRLSFHHNFEFVPSHSNKAHSALRVVLCGGDEFVNAVLRSYVDFFADRPVDLQSSLAFVIVPITEGGVGRFLVQTDLLAASLFDNAHWTSAMEQLDSDNVDWDMVMDRIQTYVRAVALQVNLPIAQAMINFKSHG